MESVLSPPSAFCFDKNSSDAWSLNEKWIKWKRSYEIYSKACEINKKPVEIQVNILLHVVGEQCRDILDRLPEKCTTIEYVWKKLDEQFQTKRNVTVERHKFFSRDQRENESIEQYVFELGKLAQTCEFRDLHDELIKDRLVCGVSSSAIRERLLREDDLSLKKAMDICRAAVASRTYSEKIKPEREDTHIVHQLNQSQKDVSFVRSKMTSSRARTRSEIPVVDTTTERRSAARGERGAARRAPRVLAASGRALAARGYNVSQWRAVPGSSRQCNYCGSVHNKFECPAYGQRCVRCSGMNHFARVCRVHYIEESESQVIYSLNNNSEWNLSLKIGETWIKFKLDTGADVNVLPLHYFKKLHISQDCLLKTKTKLSGYSGASINVIGKIFLTVNYKGKNYMLEFKVADVQSVPILGRYACTELDVVRRVMSIQSDNRLPDFIRKFEDVFQGLGCLPGQYSIHLKENAVPVVHAPRKLPFAIKEDVRKKLTEMESQKIIAKVEGPSDWVSSITVVKKPNGDLRICLDPKELNQSIKREHFRLPTLDEILSRLSGARYFSTLDASSGFWNISLDETSSSYCTFNTPFGRYKFLRMPFGICSASEVFHKKMIENFDDLEGVCMYIDDLLIFGRDKEEHDERLQKVLERCKKVNLKLNKNKCRFGLEEIKYLGHRITKNGLYPDDSHITAITKMPTPQNKKDIERFLGLVNYIGSFIPNLSDRVYPLRELLRKEIEWHWNERHDKCFQDIKHCLSSRPVLQYYDGNKPIIMSVDASKSGLGACLMQNNLPVCYASKALTKSEQRYAQIEKELYACVFACEKFYAYIYGKTDVVIETDHKPLISIIKKPITDAPARLQRMLLRLQRYTFKLVYKPGKHLYIADALSRAYEPAAAFHSSRDSLCDEVCAVSRDAASALTQYFRNAQFVALQKGTENDSDLQRVIKYINKGWPVEKKDVAELIRPYWNYRESLSVAYGLIWKSERVVVPKTLRKEMLSRIHIGHMGLEKTILRARETIFWPGINNDLKNLINSCDVCLAHKKYNPKEKLQSHEIPDSPWVKVGTDLFQLKGSNYLIIVDYYSKFFEIVELQSTDSSYVINCLKNIFCHHGIPTVIISDGGPQFSSNCFREFALEWDFKHITSSPHYPQSNGQVERMIQTVKHIMIKTREMGSDYRLAILEYLNTPLSRELPSPAELLQSRKFRSILPTSQNLLKPKVHENIKPKLLNRQREQKLYYDRGAKMLKELEKGQNVRMYNTRIKRWVPGTISRVLDNRSYEVTTPNGNKFVRNRRHITMDSAQRQDTPCYGFEYDDIDCKIGVGNEPIQTQSISIGRNNNFITRYGRTVRPPDRWGQSQVL